MNLSELNGSGRNVSAFFITAVVALLITGVAWFLLKEVNNFLRWRNKTWNASVRPAPPTQYPIGLRIYMLVWLLKRRHTLWMLRSGVLWRILINSNSHTDPEHSYERRRLTACRLVGERMINKLEEFHLCDPLHPMRWRDGLIVPNK